MRLDSSLCLAGPWEGTLLYHAGLPAARSGTRAWADDWHPAWLVHETRRLCERVSWKTEAFKLLLRQSVQEGRPRTKAEIEAEIVLWVLEGSPEGGAP